MSGDWLTYAEAAQRLGIKPESIKKRAIRRGWPRQAGNDGLARIRLPDDLPALPIPGPTPPDTARDTTGDDTRERLAAAETEIRLLRERLTDLTADRVVLRDALARAAASQAEIVRPVGSRPGFLARLLGRDR